MDPAQFLGYLRLPTKVLAAVALAALAILLLPDKWIAAIGLIELRSYKLALGLAVVIPTALVIIEGVTAGGGWVRHHIDRGLNRKAQRLDAEQAQQLADATAARERENQGRERAESLARGIQFLENMTDAEKALCTEFIGPRQRTANLSHDDGNVHQLVKRGVIYPSGAPGHFSTRYHGLAIAFTMSDWAWDHLHAHPELLATRGQQRAR